MSDIFFVVTRPDGTYVVNNPRLPTVRYWTLRSVVESWKEEWVPGGTIHTIHGQEGLDKINVELKEEYDRSTR